MWLTVFYLRRSEKRENASARPKRFCGRNQGESKKQPKENFWMGKARNDAHARRAKRQHVEGCVMQKERDWRRGEDDEG